MDRPDDMFLLTERGAHDDDGMRIDSPNFCERSDTIHYRHSYVQKHDIRMEFQISFERYFAILRLGYDVESTSQENVANSVAHKCKIVDHEDANHTNQTTSY